MKRSVVIVSLLAGMLAAAGGLTAFISTTGQDKTIESLNSSIAELQKDIKTANATAHELIQVKAVLNKATETARGTGRELTRDLDEARVRLDRLATMYGHYINLLAEENQNMRNTLAIVAARGIPVAKIPEVTGRDTLEMLRVENVILKAQIDSLKARGVHLPTTFPRGIEIKP
jgi:uncharacterized coiled-coil protein SlyX